MGKLSKLLFYCCEKDTMSKAIYRMKYLVGGFLTVSEDWSKIIMAGSIEAGRHGSASVTKRSHLIYKLQAESKRLGFWNLDAHPQSHISSNKAIFPNPSPDIPLTGDQEFKHTSLWGWGILIQTTTVTSTISQDHSQSMAAGVGRGGKYTICLTTRKWLEPVPPGFVCKEDH